MFGILIFIFILGVMGFVLAWITGVVSREEMSIGRAMFIVFINGLLVALAGFVLRGLGLPGLVNTTILTVLSLSVMSLLLRASGGIAFKQGLLIAVVFAFVTSLADRGLTSCMQNASQNYTPPPR